MILEQSIKELILINEVARYIVDVGNNPVGFYKYQKAIRRNKPAKRISNTHYIRTIKKIYK